MSLSTRELVIAAIFWVSLSDVVIATLAKGEMISFAVTGRGTEGGFSETEWEF
jgi:hypothetical protein